MIYLLSLSFFTTMASRIYWTQQIQNKGKRQLTGKLETFEVVVDDGYMSLASPVGEVIFSEKEIISYLSRWNGIYYLTTETTLYFAVPIRSSFYRIYSIPNIPLLPDREVMPCTEIFSRGYLYLRFADVSCNEKLIRRELTPREKFLIEITLQQSKK